MVHCGSPNDHAGVVFYDGVRGHPAAHVGDHPVAAPPRPHHAWSVFDHEAAARADAIREESEHLLLRAQPLLRLRLLPLPRVLLGLPVASQHLLRHEVDLRRPLLRSRHRQVVARLHGLQGLERGVEAAGGHALHVLRGDRVDPLQVGLGLVQLEALLHQQRVDRAGHVQVHGLGDPVRLELLLGQDVKFLIHGRRPDHHARVVLDGDVGDDPCVHAGHHSLAALPRPAHAWLHLAHQAPLPDDQVLEDLHHLRLGAVMVGDRSLLGLGARRRVAAHAVGVHEVDLRGPLLRGGHGQEVALAQGLHGAPCGLEPAGGHQPEVRVRDLVDPLLDALLGFVQLELGLPALSALLLARLAIRLPVFFKLLAGKDVELLAVCVRPDDHARVVSDDDLGDDPPVHARDHALALHAGADHAPRRLLHEATVLHDPLPEEPQHVLLRGVPEAVEVEDQGRLLVSSWQQRVHAAAVRAHEDGAQTARLAEPLRQRQPRGVPRAARAAVGPQQLVALRGVPQVPRGGHDGPTVREDKGAILGVPFQWDQQGSRCLRQLGGQALQLLLRPAVGLAVRAEVLEHGLEVLG
mmetsp:Transcript_46514/g.111444  ORF Transcript_46514/g.111444 Transcript_46514/m.111444 type:complete len:579 (-) Transcript_46514:568-2304(-)